MPDPRLAVAASFSFQYDKFVNRENIGVRGPVAIVYSNPPHAVAWTGVYCMRCIWGHGAFNFEWDNISCFLVPFTN